TVAKPQGFVGSHGIHHQLAQAGRGLLLYLTYQLPQTADTTLGQQPTETTGHQILLVVPQHDAAGALQVIPEQVEVRIICRHASTPDPRNHIQACSTPAPRIRASTLSASSSGQNLARKSSAPTLLTMACLNTPDREVCSITCRSFSRGSLRTSAVRV